MNNNSTLNQDVFNTKTQKELVNEFRTHLDEKFLLKLHPRSHVAKFLGISHLTLNLLIDQGRIKVIFVGKKPKIPGTEIERFLKESLVTPETLSKAKKIYDLDSFRNGGDDFKNSFDSMKLFEKMSVGVANG